MSHLLIGKQLIEEKHRLFKLQNGICPLCHRALNDDVQSNHLDHDHSLFGEKAGKCRGLLCVYCNALEGQIKHKFNSSGLASRGVDPNEWLISLVEYYKTDLSNNPIHPKFVADMTKHFSKQNIPEMDLLAEQYGLKFEGKLTKAQKVPLFKKAMKLFLKVVK